jgi:DNA invertase Pin-like site-specific DNA recombinase
MSTWRMRRGINPHDLRLCTRQPDAQTLDAQTEALTAAGALKVYSEKESGAKTNRPALARAIAALDAGDVTRLDRLARSTLDLLNVLDAVSKRMAGFRSRQDAWLIPLRRTDG